MLIESDFVFALLCNGKRINVAFGCTPEGKKIAFKNFMYW